MLGRARRRVLVFDHGRYRNAASRRMHGYLGLDGIAPVRLLQAGRAQLVRYGVSLRSEEVLDIRVQGRDRGRGAFRVFLASGRSFQAKKLLLATGVCDVIPPIPGVDAFYGVSVHHCPYCDAWEWRDRRLAVYGHGKAGVALAHALLSWSSDVALLTDGPGRINREDRAELRTRGIQVLPDRIERLEGRGGMLRQIRFRARPPLPRDALFFSTGNDQSCDLAARLGCTVTPKAAVRTDRRERTNVPGVYVAGDASWDVQFVVVAAAEGAKAAVAINRELQAEERAAARQAKRV
jgi:thioredoxin reductase